VVVGERDFADHHAIAGILQRRIPNAQKVVLPDVGHVSMMEAPERFNDTVMAFLAAL
jgi:pimeloyl-ACP methyl ester carboxylesterase